MSGLTIKSTDYIGILEGDSKKVKHPLDPGRVITLYRIIALKSFRIKKFSITIDKHTTGGWVESLENVCNEPLWINAHARVFDKAVISNDSYIDDFALIFGNAKVNGSRVQNWSRVYGDALVDDSLIKDFSEVRGNCKIISSKLFNGSKVEDNAIVKDSNLKEGAYCCDNCEVENTFMSGASTIRGNSVVRKCNLEEHAVVFEGKKENEKIVRTHDLSQRIVDPSNDPYPEKIYGKGSRIIRSKVKR